MYPYTELRRQAARALVPPVLLLIAGCAGAPAPIVDATEDEPVVETAAPVETSVPETPPPDAEEARTFALPDDAQAVIDPSTPVDGTAPTEPPPAVEAPARTTSPAVVALVDAAAAQANSGDAEQAAATLERALRIEPSNPALWHRLAVLRMQQEQYEQAMELAMRSNSLAHGDPALLEANRRVLEQCRTALARTQRG